MTFGSQADLSESQRIVDRCLESEAAYKLFDMLGAVSRLDMEDRLEYIELVKDSGLYTDEEIEKVCEVTIPISALASRPLVCHTSCASGRYG